MASIGQYMDGEDATKNLAGDVQFEGLEEETEKGMDLLAKSLDKNISEYNKHPLIEGTDKLLDNSEAQNGLKQILRGVEGITGKETQLALMDVLSGAIRVFKSINRSTEE